MNDVINKYLSNITKISYINSNVYIETFANNYIVLDKKIDKNKLFDFFRKVDFNFYLFATVEIVETEYYKVKNRVYNHYSNSFISHVQKCNDYGSVKYNLNNLYNS